MTAARISQTALRDAADVACATGAVITIEVGNRVYRIAPEGAKVPVGATEKDAATCDELFGTSS